eukprot:maker-scaffold1334_size47063-snap-gene-0.12 protein:Tk08780 transcript:maker-scaffold1334_size47063-snap-gene-0.12-mRNA-1 annotation:"membrane-associated tyrosine- and threonine-specific cdc2-inhibitory kinase"
MGDRMAAVGRDPSHSSTLPAPKFPSPRSMGAPSRLSQSFSLPKPNFGEQAQTFSTKKARATPKFRPPPRPPAKTCPPVSRVFSRRRGSLPRAQSVTFVDQPSGSMTPEPIGTPMAASSVYDESIGQSYFEQAFSVEQEIGQGYFGKVYRVRSKQDGQLYAVKIAQDCYKGLSDRGRKLEEVRKHEFLLPHPNCVRFHQSWEEAERLYQQFELCEKSLDELSEEKHDLPEKLIWGYLVDLLLALQHLHEHNLIHMDVKPENIFIGRDGICKLGDFGLVLDLSKDDLSFQHNYGGGDSKYMANEALSHMYTPAADVFSLGLTILELACDLVLPNNGPLWHQLRENGPDPGFTAQLSPELRRVIQLMTARDPHRRPSVSQLLKLPCIEKAKNARQRELHLKKWVAGVKKVMMPVFRALLVLFAFIVVPLINGIHKLIGYHRDDRSHSPPSKRSSGTQEDLQDDHTPSNKNISLNGTKLTFSSDEDENQNHSLSSTHSVLACPLAPSDSSPLRTRDEKVFPEGNVPSPIPSPRDTFQIPPRQVQSTPSGMKTRRRVSCNNWKSPSKKLDFTNLDEIDGEMAPPKAIPRPRLSPMEKSDPNVISPVSLAAKFDCFSDSE